MVSRSKQASREVRILRGLLSRWLSRLYGTSYPELRSQGNHAREVLTVGDAAATLANVHTSGKVMWPYVHHINNDAMPLPLNPGTSNLV